MTIDRNSENKFSPSPYSSFDVLKSMVPRRRRSDLNEEKRLVASFMTNALSTWSGRLVSLSLLIQFIQFLAVALLPHPLGISNLTQLLLPLIAFVACVSKRRSTDDLILRSLWMKLSIAFVFWEVAEVVYLAELYLIPKSYGITWPDDVLWLLFALPIVMATSQSSGPKVNWIDLFDHGQAFVFFAILLSCVFLAPHALPFNTAYNFQNLTILLSSLLRTSTVKNKSSYRFFARLSAYLSVYCLCAGIGNALSTKGMLPGSVVDLFWTVPITFFCVLATWREGDSATVKPRPRWAHNLARSTQGISALGLALVSIGAAAAALPQHPSLGYISLLGAFGLFAVRTVVREYESYRSDDQLRESALRDPLTGVGNRSQFRASVSQAVASVGSEDKKIALMFIDLDRFKVVNDEFGHAIGDKLLIEVANRLRLASREEDLVCRLGGDEFVITMILADEAVAKARAEAVLEALRKPLMLGERDLRITASIGVILGNVGEDVETLLSKADDAMYRAKKRGKNQIQIFNAELLDQFNSNWALEQALLQCLDEDGVEVVFQPIYSMDLGVAAGFEALARWTHPGLGIISPAIFIPLAEEAGLIQRLGSQVLLKACRQVATWNKCWSKDFFVSVNISVKQFAHMDLLPSVLRIVEESGLAAHRLHLEITESVLLLQDMAVERILVDARAHGIGISLDDFGTGYSSLSYLLNLPVDEIKIDRSFIHDLHIDPRRVELVRAVLTLGQTLGKKVVAEGVENQAQLDILRALGCQMIQGYFLSKPLDAENVQGFLQTTPLTHID